MGITYGKISKRGVCGKAFKNVDIATVIPPSSYSLNELRFRCIRKGAVGGPFVRVVGRDCFGEEE